MSPYVRSRTFCCCLPVRLGVFILSILSLVGGSFLAVYGWIQIHQLKEHPLAKADVIALWIQSSLFSFLAVLAIFGFFGAMMRNRAMISGFAIALAIHLGFSVASGAFAIYAMFARDSQSALATCIQNAQNAQNANDSGPSDVTTQSCKQAVVIIKAVVVAIYVLTWLIQLYAYFVVERYAEQLDEERMAANAVVVPRTMVGGPQATTYTGFADSRQGFGTRDPSHMA